MAERPQDDAEHEGSLRLPGPGPEARPGRISPETASLWHHWNDLAAETLIYAALFLASWGFGATQRWCIDTINALGWAIGGTGLVRRLLSWAAGHSPPRWGDPPVKDESEPLPGAFILRAAVMKAMAGLTLAILGYVALGLANSRVIEGQLVKESVAWLPHTYNAPQTWFALHEYLGLACLFWAAWDWMRGKTREEQESYFEKLPERFNAQVPMIPSRAARFLAFLTANGGTLAVASILQRLSGTGELLWIMPSTIGDASFHFGPFNYRANGAQYFNLLWPVCLAFWWLSRARHLAGTQLNERTGTGAYEVLFPFAALMGACPIISTNRVGAVLLIMAAPILYGLLAWDARRRNNQHRTSLHALFACLLALGLYLGWMPLEKRLGRVSHELRVDPAWAQRQEQYRSTTHLIEDHWIFGTGPRAYETVYRFHLAPGQAAYPYAHSDWIQTVAEWGVTGGILVFALLALAVLGPGWIGLGEPLLIQAAWAGMGLVLVHALVDFPMQIHGILVTFTLLAALTLSLPPRHESE
ncbi:MAG: O-antigen ligase family protein [Verrucomicrobia bacterium]|nr:O-antigen ligase family protein [Verrucomicrobiota bacterium]